MPGIFFFKKQTHTRTKNEKYGNCLCYQDKILTLPFPLWKQF